MNRFNAQTRKFAALASVGALANAQTRKFAALASVGALALASNAAQAAIDVTDVVTEIEGTIAPIGLIGAAVLTVIVAVAAFKWVRRAIS